jgi:hypothetical protein
MRRDALAWGQAEADRESVESFWCNKHLVHTVETIRHTFRGHASGL